MLLWYLRYELWGSRSIAEVTASERAGGWDEPEVEVSHQANVPNPKSTEGMTMQQRNGR